MKCNLCGVAGDFGTRIWNGTPTPLKRCSSCRSYFKEWRKAPGSKAKTSEARHESTSNRKLKKQAATAAWNHSERGISKRRQNQKQPHRLECERELAKTPKGRAKQKRSNAKKYVKLRADPEAWLEEKIRLKVGLMFRGHQFGGHGFSQTIMDFTEFISTIDIMDHFSDQFEDGMTTALASGALATAFHRRITVQAIQRTLGVVGRMPTCSRSGTARTSSRTSQCHRTASCSV